MASKSVIPDATQKIDVYKSFSAPPEWMSRDYLEKVLRELENDPSLKLLEYNIASATKPGDNFASIALRLRTTYLVVKEGRQKSKSFIVKVEPYEEGFKKDILSDTVLFETETQIYTKILPEMQQLIKEVDCEEIIAPPLGYFALKPNKIILIEDISPAFGMSEKPISFEHALKVFEKIAKFRAISLFMHENKGVSFAQFTEGFISKQFDGASIMLIESWTAFAHTIKEWGGEMEVIGEKLLKIIPTMYGKLGNLFQANNVGYNVLNHGDFHLKNILFRQGADNLQNWDLIRLIDFQLCIWASPAIDLIFALYGIVNHDARIRREDLILAYHNQFTKTLQQLGYLKDIPSLLDLQAELLRNGLIEVFMVAYLMPFLYTDPTLLKDSTEMTLEKMGQLRKLTLESEPLKTVLTNLLPIFMDKGFFD